MTKTKWTPLCPSRGEMWSYRRNGGGIDLKSGSHRFGFDTETVNMQGGNKATAVGLAQLARELVSCITGR